MTHDEPRRIAAIVAKLPGASAYVIYRAIKQFLAATDPEPAARRPVPARTQSGCKMIGETFKRWGLFALHCLLTRPASGPIVVETRNSGLARRGRN